MKTALRKLSGDIRATPGRYSMMVIAIAFSSAAIVAMLLAYIVLTREVQRNYIATNPSSVQIIIDKKTSDDEIENALSTIVKNPSIDDAEIGGQFYSKVEISPNQFVTALIFVLPDLPRVRINKPTLDAGEWPDINEILLERKALGVAKTVIGKNIQLIGQNGLTHSLRVSGSVHDPALAPANTEHMIYGYMSKTSFLHLQEPVDANFIKLTVKPEKQNTLAIEHIAEEILNNISSIVDVTEIRIPPLGLHPHQTQMESGLKMLLLFSLLAVVLGAVLIATTIWGLLAQQVQQIGIMKTIGASSTQIFSLYFMLLTIIGIIALIIGFPLGILAGNTFIHMSANLLNINITDYSLPKSVWILNIIFCIGLPLLISIFPIRAAAIKTIRAALDDYGISHYSAEKIQTGCKFRFISPLWIMILRNIFRRRQRLFFTLILLAVAGATFISSQNLLSSWDKLGEQAQAYRHYQIEARFSDRISTDTIKTEIQQIPGINRAEFFTRYPATPITASGFAIKRVYPDGGHGSLTLYAVPANTDMLSIQLTHGNWLNDNGIDTAMNAGMDDVVINQTAWHQFFPEKTIGDSIDVQLEGKNYQYRLNGIVAEPLSGASLYINPRPSLKSNAVRIRLDKPTASSIDDLALQLEKTLKQSNIHLYGISTENFRKISSSGHLKIMVLVLVMISITMILVGFISLAIIISTSVNERLREFAVMRTLGAKHLTIFSLVINESLLISLCSYLLAFPIAILFSFCMVQVLAAISLQPLTVTTSISGLFNWLLIALLGAIIAAFIPALNAMRFTIKEALTHS
ncbi:ABC transporter permease [Cellvibrio sp. QJXJ]|uniref:ABC transporter permease n=1 Tax=Cellvibrio sp. QJXJ TaxID=2964606 RepID=UPI0021C28981|nr:ABC transporter permease [Cellvibrio sp. QJXJ]UUA71651.1 ABC transporter permease [Cellvibrio sp. QJXJ]